MREEKELVQTNTPALPSDVKKESQLALGAGQWARIAGLALGTVLAFYDGRDRPVAAGDAPSLENFDAAPDCGLHWHRRRRHSAGRLSL